MCMLMGPEYKMADIRWLDFLRDEEEKLCHVEQSTLSKLVRG